MFELPCISQIQNIQIIKYNSMFMKYLYHTFLTDMKMMNRQYFFVFVCVYTSPKLFVSTHHLNCLCLHIT